MIRRAVVAVVVVSGVVGGVAGGATGVARAATQPPAGAPAGFTACETLLLQQPERYESYDCLLRAARRTGDWARARRLLDARLAVRAADTNALAARAFLAYEQLEPDAPARLRTAAEACVRAGDRVNEAWVRRGIAALATQAGDFDAARAELDAARRTGAATPGSRLGVALTMTEAALLTATTAYGRALEVLDALPAASVAEQPDWLQAEVADARGNALWGLGRMDEALAAQRARLAIARASGSRFAEASAIYSVTVVESRVRHGMSPELIALAREGLELARASGNPRAEIALLMSLSQAPKTQVAERIALLRRVVARTDPARDLSAATFARRELARWLIDTDPAASFALVDEAIAMSAARGDLFGVARGRMRRAFFIFDDPSLDTRVKAAVEAADAIERIRDLQPDALSQARTFGEWGFFYYQALDALLGAAPGPAELDAAFSVAERLRSQVLRSELDAAGATPHLGGEDPARAEHQRTLQALASARRELAAASPGDVAAARDEVDRLESRADELRRRILATSTRIAEIWGAGAAGIDEVRASLAPDQALFAYVFPPAHQRNRSRPRAFVVSSAGARVEDLQASPAVDSAIVLLEGAISRRDGSERAALATLHRALVEPCLAGLPAGVRRVVVVPDGALHRVPLEALAAGGSSPFGLQFEVSRTPSATLWLRWRKGSYPSPPRVFAIGDPASEPRDSDGDAALGTREALGPLARAPRGPRGRCDGSRKPGPDR